MRSKWKGAYVNPFLKEQIKEGFKKKSIKVFSRSSTILPEYEGGKFLIYNGKTFTPIKVFKEMFYKKFGEYSLTKSMGSLIHILKKRKKKKKKR